MKSRKTLLWIAAVTLLLSIATAVSADAANALDGGAYIWQITNRGAFAFPKGSDIPATIDSHGIEAPEFRLLSIERHANSPKATAPVNQAQAAPLTIPEVKSSAIASASPNLGTSFEGLNLFQQRYANGGNQFSVEPPDQGLCVGNGYVLETVNTVLRVYTSAGDPASFVTDLNTFYGYPAQFDRATGVSGPFMTDPSCYYDTDTQRWFHVALTLDVVPDTGAFTGGNHLDIAVSQTPSPLGLWNFYSLPVQNTGDAGTPRHPGCPCIGDYPQIGADKNGFYITTNEYPFSDDPGVFGNNFNGAQLYALPKKALAAGRPNIRVVQFQNLKLPHNTPGFTVWPARSPNGAYATQGGGSEYFLSSTAGEEALNERGIDNRIGFWVLSNTSTLDSSKPHLKLARTLLTSETYGVPPLSEQKIGPVPLRDCLLIECLADVGPSRPETEGPIDSNDSRMQQVWYANGRVWGALDTIVNVDGNIRAGVSFFVINPSAVGFTNSEIEQDVSDAADISAAASSKLNATIEKQGYIAVANHGVLYPAIAVLENGNGVMALSLVGRDYYPTAAYALISSSGVSDIQIAALGRAPQDGFCEYLFFNCGGTDQAPAIRPRWGDYGAAATDGKTIWIASEYIAHACTLSEYSADPTCGRTRAVLGNWSTRISAVTP